MIRINQRLRPVSFLETLRLLNNVVRPSSSARKKFYKSASVVSSEGNYEVTLDHRKLKTPNGAPFVVKSEPLAIAVATEWAAQKETIAASSMHLTALSFTAIDNPNKLEKLDIVNYLINYICTDTVLFHCNEDNDLYDLQVKEWDPMIKWFNERYEVGIEKSRDLTNPPISIDAKMKISKYLMSYDLSSLHGIVFATDVLKSLILALACLNMHVPIDRAVVLCRLEEEYQVGYWGRVEWSHDVSQQDLQARLAAGILFTHFNSSSSLQKQKVIC